MRPTEIRAVYLLPALILIVMLTSTAARPSPLFDEDSVLEIKLSGPLDTLIDNKKSRSDYPFVLSTDDVDINIDVRKRGNSRTVVCRFPPLRLQFKQEESSGTVFADQGKIKLVTHCKRDDERAENNVLDEYAAYQILNLISDASFRVRLLRVSFDDTDGKQKGLDRAYYGFLIEPDKALAARIGGQTTDIEGLLYSPLNAEQVALMYVFQYLIGNTDWSLVRADTADTCCHNIELIDMDGDLYAVPYDFDLSGLVDAVYAKPGPSLNTMRVTKRVYRGYCRTPIESVATALQTINGMKDAILAEVENVPALNEKSAKSRRRFLQSFFEQAQDHEELLRQFEQRCVGRS